MRHVSPNLLHACSDVSGGTDPHKALRCQFVCNVVISWEGNVKCQSQCNQHAAFTPWDGPAEMWRATLVAMA
jgi:hypothetical protein